MADLYGANGQREHFRVVGRSNIPGLTSYALATGVAKFGSDYVFPDMAFARILRSPYAHAKVISIDATDALAIPGVLDVVKWDDPIFNEIQLSPFANGPRPTYLMQEAHYEGDEVGAVVIAESEALCDEALHALKIEWEVLPFIADLKKGLDPSIPNIRGPEWDEWEKASYIPNPARITRRGDYILAPHLPGDPPRQGNVSFNNKIEGDMEEGWAKADFILEYDVNVKAVVSLLPNPPSSVAYWGDSMYKGPNKKIFIEGAVNRREAIMAIYKLPSDGVVQEGLFQGGKYCDWGLRMSQEITPLLAKRVGRPVRCCNTREENFNMQRFDRFGHLRVGVTNEGLITAIEDNSLADNGSPNSCVMGATSDRDFTSYYTLKCENIAQHYKVVDSNMGFMHTCSQFVPYNWDHMTVGLYMIAEKLGKDPVEIARLNVHGPDSQKDMRMLPSFEATIAEGKRIMNWESHPSRTKQLPDGRWHGSSFRYSMLPRHAFMEYFIQLEYRDGVVHFPTQGPVVGWFGTECFTMIAAEELGLEFEDISVDYDYREKHSDQAGGSDGVTGHGWLVKECANDLKNKILESAARYAMHDAVINYGPFTREVGISPIRGYSAEELDILDGKVFVKADPSKFVPFKEATKENLVASRGGHSPDAAWSTGFGRILDTMATTWCDVAVDEETGIVEVLKYCVVPDVGKVIRRTSLESQIDQVIYFTYGAQLLEEYILDPETGVKLNGNMIDYKRPTTLDIPVVDKGILELRTGTAAYGASGISHNLANSHQIIIAIHNAIGVWVDPPATPDRVLKALGKY